MAKRVFLPKYDNLNRFSFYNHLRHFLPYETLLRTKSEDDWVTYNTLDALNNSKSVIPIDLRSKHKPFDNFKKYKHFQI